MSYLTESLKIEILMMIGYGDRARTQCEVVRLFRETHPHLPPLNHGTISKIEAQYREMGHVRKVPSKRQAVVDDDTKLNLLLALEENPITPARQLARDNANLVGETRVEKSVEFWLTVESMLSQIAEQIAVEPLVYKETGDVKDLPKSGRRRITQAKKIDIVLSMEENPQSTSTLVASKNEVSQTTVLRILRKENYHPYKFHHVLSKRHSEPSKLQVLKSGRILIGSKHIFNIRRNGPFFFEKTLTGERYLEFLQNDLVPALAVIFPNENDPDIPDNTLWFQQDGAPPHYARSGCIQLKLFLHGRKE
ncbi:hypothetical protein NQ318_019301 [Aromia moschata]|uniref:DUF4817 domain-containing protein n=1 Tax=Aromia moschata TaxID=1265417 RepID=A0AAV8X3Y0_9CUCU|nr:hypothetical protein NQ318_019301 [Aromia moschata]